VQSGMSSDASRTSSCIRTPLPVILKTYLYTGVRLATAGRLRVKDFHHQAAPHAQVSIRRCVRDRIRQYFGNRHHAFTAPAGSLAATRSRGIADSSLRPCPVFCGYSCD
jgi:hypothetical protein